MRKNRGYYTIDTSDLYWYYDPKTNLVAEVTLYKKKGDWKGIALERKCYNIIQKRIQHWESYEPSTGNK